MHTHTAALEVAWSTSALFVNAQANALANEMGHDTVDSYHVLAVVQLGEPGSFPSAEPYLMDIDWTPDALSRDLQRAFVSFEKMPDIRYQTPAYQRMMALAQAFAAARRANSDDTASVTVGDLVAAARMSGSPQLDKLLDTDYQSIVTRVIDVG